MRGKPAPKRLPPTDPKYDNQLVGKLINLIMKKGKKTTAQSVVYDAFDYIQKQTKKEPVTVFEMAMSNVAPIMEVKSKRIGGANYQIPMEVRGGRKIVLPLRWIIDAARSKKGKPMSIKLAEEVIAASQKQGDAMKKRDDVHRMAEANRAFAHFA